MGSRTDHRTPGILVILLTNCPSPLSEIHIDLTSFEDFVNFEEVYNAITTNPLHLKHDTKNDASTSASLVTTRRYPWDIQRLVSRHRLPHNLGWGWGVLHTNPNPKWQDLPKLSFSGGRWVRGGGTPDQHS